MIALVNQVTRSGFVFILDILPRPRAGKYVLRA